MLGFLLGVGFMWLWNTPKPSVHGGQEGKTAAMATLGQATPSLKPAASPEVTPTAKPQPARKRRLSEIEAVFEEWGQYAIWDQNRTEVALWNSEQNAYADFYEVWRDPSGGLYFRSLPRLTRPVLAHASKTEAPLLFTESLAMRKEWMEARRELVPATPMPTLPKDLSTSAKPEAGVEVQGTKTSP